MAYFDDMQSLYLHQPHEVSLETIALCNAACTFCPYPTLERKGEKMTDELIDKVITEMSEWKTPFYFSPFKVNEPLLDKRLFDICERVVRETVAVLRIFTNGAALTQKHIDRIAGLDRVVHLWVSLNSTDPEEYQELMNMDFERTAKRLDNLHAQDFPHPVVLSTVGYPNEDFRYYCYKRWPRFESIAIGRSAWLGYTHSDIEEVPDTPCGRWFELSITSSGVVSLCCMDGAAAYPIGDIREQTLLEVYNAPDWLRRREGLISRREVAPCDQCTY